MHIGLIDVDSKYPNLALMKISAYHKTIGNNVSWFSPLFPQYFDKVYASKVFTKSIINYVPADAIQGGSGYNYKTILPENIEHIYPDYSLYPNVDYAMGFLTRGCINKCPFCIVWKKEGILHKHAELEEFWNGQTKLMLLDNCLTDYKDAEKELLKIRDNDIKLNLTQGFNIRTIRPKIANILSEISLWKGKQWYFAWDNISDEKLVMKGLNILNTAGLKNWKFMCYVLVGFNSSPKEDLHRINTLEKMGIDPFVMCYVKTSYTKALAKWVNRKPLFKSTDFISYAKSRKDACYILPLLKP